MADIVKEDAAEEPAVKEEKPEETSKEDQVAAAKAKGTEAYKNKDYEEAIKFYSEAIAISESDHTLYSNRSAAYSSQGLFQEALADAEACIRLRPEWAKGYCRQGYALYHLRRYQDSRQSYLDGLKQDSTSNMLKEELKLVEEAIEKEEKAKKAAQAAPSSSSKRAKRTGFKGHLSKLINPLGLGTKGAILYAITVVTVIGFFVMLRASKFRAASSAGSARDIDGSAEL